MHGNTKIEDKIGLLIHHTASCAVPLNFLCSLICNYFFKDLPISMLHDTRKNVRMELSVCYYDCRSFTLNLQAPCVLCIGQAFRYSP